MARNVTHFIPRNYSNCKTPLEYSVIPAPDNCPCCQYCGKKCCGLGYGKLDELAELGQKRRKNDRLAKLQDSYMKTMQRQKCLAMTRKEQEYKKTPRKGKCRSSSCISPNMCGVGAVPAPATMVSCPAQPAVSTKRGSRLGWMICSHPARPCSPHLEAPLDTNNAVEMTNGQILINCGTGKCPEFQYCFADNPELQYKALLKRAHMLRMKEKQLQLKEKEIQKKNKNLRKRRRKFLKRGNAREKAELQASKVMEFARDKLIAFQTSACGDTIIAKRGNLKCRLVPSTLMPCLCKVSGKGDQSTCRGSCVKRLFGLSNPCPVRKSSFPFSCMVKGEEMMKRRKVRSWATTKDACQPILRSPPLPWIQPMAYLRRHWDPKSHWRRLGYSLLCVAGVMYWVPVWIFLHCLICCCHSE